MAEVTLSCYFGVFTFVRYGKTHLGKAVGIEPSFLAECASFLLPSSTYSLEISISDSRWHFMFSICSQQIPVVMLKEDALVDRLKRPRARPHRAISKNKVRLPMENTVHWCFASKKISLSMNALLRSQSYHHENIMNNSLVLGNRID